MAWYRTRTVQFPTMNTFALATADGSRGTVGNFVVPDEAHSIPEINVSIGDSARVSTACGGIVILRLSGSGMAHGVQYIPILGKSCLDLSNTGKCFINPRVSIPVKIAVIPGMEIEASLTYSGTTMGTAEGTIGLTFSPASVGKYIYIARNGDTSGGVGAIASIATTLAGVTVGAPNLVGYKRITKFIVVTGNRTPLSSTSGVNICAVLRGTCLGPSTDIRLPGAAESVLDHTTGTSHGYHRPMIANTDIPLQSGTLGIDVYANGADTGLPVIGVGLELEA